MEVIGYEIPQSWEDKGMDWDSPDPRNADYIMAIREALFERHAAIHSTCYYGLDAISPWKTVDLETVETVCYAIRSLAYRFFRPDWTEYEADWSDFPHNWTWNELVEDDPSRLVEWPKTGDILADGGEWLKRAKRVIDKLTCIRLENAYGTKLSRSGARHDPPFAESIGDAMEQALDDSRGLTTSVVTRVPSSITAWSGNTHWKCPRPDWEGDPEDNKDGYCGYAQSTAYSFTMAKSWLAYAEADIRAYVVASAPTGAVPYSSVLDESVFDSGEMNLRVGMNELEKYHAEDLRKIEWSLGASRSIPKNAIVPVSEFDEEGNATTRHSAKRGYEGKVWIFLDYGCRNGFKFRNKEGEN